MRITKRQLRRIIREAEGSTKKYDDDSALKGDQSKLPDGLQKGIIDKTVEDREEREEEEREEKNESVRITRRQLRRIVREAVGYYSDEDMPEAWHAGYDDALNGDSPISVDPDYEDGFEAGMADLQSPPRGSELEVGADLVAGVEERLRDWGH